MKPPLFEYSAPRTLPEAISLLANDPGAMVLAGGQSLIPAMNFRLSSPSRLVDIQHVDGLRGIDVSNGRIVVKAMTRHRELELSDAAFQANPLIRETIANVAHVPIRNRGTVVGSLCHADAAAELPLLLLLTGGAVVAEGPQGRREIAARDFFTFHMTTSRLPGEIIVEARFPALPPGAGWAFLEFTRRHGDYAIASVGAIVRRFGGRAEVSLAAGGISSRPIILTAAQDVLNGSDLSAGKLAEAGKAAAQAVTAADDIHATADYRRRLVAALVGRTVSKALSRVS
ncbi:FAD binding domain-containing protein [Hyphomicrobium sp. CS1GBMeth3]|uniref:FAD binding domain-containing protein n=1 Tax=Hyphomicrobium sp. CS1GBMeth3 TaxID=1892845 RepID=UPI0009300211|nr:FAD binding domain-containing protein [Hyphomicrobium sp. CS1GBMeth3]